MKKIIHVFILLLTACICISCFHTDKEHTKNPIESANVNVTENSDFVPRRSPNPEVIIKKASQFFQKYLDHT